MANEAELQRARQAHALALQEQGIAPYPSHAFSEEQESQRRNFVVLAQDAQACAGLPHEADIAADAPHLHLYGRVVAKRGPFVVFRTPYGDAQALVRSENLPPRAAAAWPLLDLADHAGVVGVPMQTRTGAAALRAVDFMHLGKAVLPPPDKWHGLRDIEKRYRERYVDLFAQPAVADVFRARSRIVRELREALSELGFLEVETPMLQSLRGGATAKPFCTHHQALDLPMYLRVAPELHLKRLLVGGLDRVFEIGRAFRNEGVSTRHNPEFSLLEAYQAYATYLQLMDTVESLLRRVDAAVRRGFPQLSAGRSFDLEAPFVRVSMRQALVERGQRRQACDIAATPWESALAPEVVFDAERLPSFCHRLADQLPPEARLAWHRLSRYGEVVYRLFETVVEPDLSKLYRNADGTASLPVFITEYPAEVSPLARHDDRDAAWVDRYELFVEGRELANAFTELNDPFDQAERFRAQLLRREHGDEEAMDFDADYIRALSHGMPPAAGFGIGIDRLVMTLCNQTSIRDVLLFPLLKPEAAE